MWGSSIAFGDEVVVVDAVILCLGKGEPTIKRKTQRVITIITLFAQGSQIHGLTVFSIRGEFLIILKVNIQMSSQHLILRQLHANRLLHEF